MASLFLLISLALANDECWKSIKVQEVIFKSNPNPFVKVEEKVKEGDTKTVQIKCDLYKQVKVGELLTESGSDVTAIRLFNNRSDRGIIERKRYKVLEK